ncbi:hypothetical protein IP98_00690 [Flavobacterium cauense R2A-7]|uniref:Carboxypeptidase-like protein n=1 Tax=Flavobacterium cauense R2A-7 TaxID=1341154 RepID=A0A562M447_9FLAO|nr:hypothetical protein [Flavobacterium cauense]KGO83943.1 hypothetical protein Q762_01475 [Flavobacterium cauense R2A-7]TWI14719.1 hypothetical protein IP98_00690 [Flavobacterium cauense R2A-7]
MRNKLLFFFILISSVSWSQNLKVLKGQIVAKTREVKGISITNLSSNRTVVSEEKGLFLITAKTGDTLLFTAVQLQPRKIVLGKEDFDYLTFFVSMNVKVIRLNEIIIEKSNITAESLGLVPKGIKTQSQEERAVRRYYTAQTGPLQALIYAIDGTAKRRKKEIIAVVGHQRLQHKLELMFNQSYFVDELKIPSEHLFGFYVFASENQGLANVMQQKNKWLIKFELIKIASEYIKLLSGEN